MSQTQFAGLGEASKRAQINYEQGDSTPDASYLAAVSAVGVDIQYVVTGIRSAASLAPMEQLFLERFRGAPKAVQDEALLTLMGQQGLPSSAKQIFHASVGQAIEGDATFNKGVNFDLSKK
jgi:transcriptional regulator with XRE-family HTH domain